jgi:hypothetical protein
LPEIVDYNLHVKPILSDNCFFCHGPDKNSQKAGLELATREGALAPLKESKGKFAIVPGNLKGARCTTASLRRMTSSGCRPRNRTGNCRLPKGGAGPLD